MNRFFCANPVISQGTILINDKDKLHHIKRVLCLKPKEEVLVFDNTGTEYFCSIQKLGQEIVLQIKEKRLPEKNKSGINLTIACAIPKNARFDDIVDKLTQLGVDRIIPLVSQRVVVNLDRKKEESRLKRWRKIAEAASQQSQRNNVPTVEPIKKFKEALATPKGFDLKLIPTLTGKRKSLHEILPISLPVANILILIGPEGDFSDEEVAAAKDAGFIPISLGNLVLRVDTAAIAIAAIIKNN
jgi:16S rRNA (uracil1498-N3)-methyltransferase